MKIHYCFVPKFDTDISYEDISKNLNYFENFSNQFWNKLRKTKKTKTYYMIKIMSMLQFM